MRLDETLNRLYTIKKTMRALREEEHEIKDLIHEFMTRKQTNQLESENFIVKRKIQTITRILKDTIDIELWDELASYKEYPRLTISKK